MCVHCVFVLMYVDASLQPYLDQINQIEEQVSALEQAAYKLDTYSKKLGKSYFHLGYANIVHTTHQGIVR